jgi:hypothetical protein
LLKRSGQYGTLCHQHYPALQQNILNRGWADFQLNTNAIESLKLPSPNEDKAFELSHQLVGNKAYSHVDENRVLWFSGPEGVDGMWTR